MAREITLTTGPDLWPQLGDPTDEAVEITALEGNDTITGTGFDDLILGNQGDDELDGVAGDDTIYGGQGNDTLEGLLGNNLLLGNQGDDVITLGTGNNEVYGGQGNDTITAGSGDNAIYGNLGDDLLISGPGGNNLLHGGQGNDTIEAATGEGSDTLIGGVGNDTFVFAADTAPANTVFGNLDSGSPDDGIDTILVTGDNDFTTTSFTDIQVIQVETDVTAIFTLASLAGVSTLAGDGTIQINSTSDDIVAFLESLGTGVADTLTFLDAEGNPVEFPPIPGDATLTVNIDDVSVAGVINAPLATAVDNVFSVPTLQSGDKVTGLGEEDVLNARIGSNTLIANIPPILAEITDVETINLTAERLNSQGFSSNPFQVNASQITGTDTFIASNNTGVVRVAGITENAEVILRNSVAGFQTTFAGGVTGTATIRFQNAQLPNDYISVEPESGGGFDTFNIYSETSSLAETVTNEVGHIISKTVETNGARGPLVNGGTDLRTVNITGVQDLNLTGNVSPLVASLPGEVTTINANGLRDAAGELLLDAEGNEVFPVFEGDLTIGRAPANDIFFQGGSGDDFIDFEKTLDEDDRIEGGEGDDTVRATFEKTVVANGVIGTIEEVNTDPPIPKFGLADVPATVVYAGAAAVFDLATGSEVLPIFLDNGGTPLQLNDDTLFLKATRTISIQTDPTGSIPPIFNNVDVFIEGTPRPIDDIAIRQLSGQEYAFDQFNFNGTERPTLSIDGNAPRTIISISQGQANPSLIPDVVVLPLPTITIGGQERSIPLFIAKDETGAEVYYSWLVEPGTRNALDANRVPIDPNQPTDRQPALFRINPNNFIEFPDGIGTPGGVGNVNGGSYGPALDGNGQPIYALALDELNFDLNYLNTRFADTVTETFFDGDGNEVTETRSTLYTKILQSDGSLSGLVAVDSLFVPTGDPGPLFNTANGPSNQHFNELPVQIGIVTEPGFGGFSPDPNQIVTNTTNEPSSTLKLKDVENLELTVNIFAGDPNVTFEEVTYQYVDIAGNVITAPSAEYIQFKNDFINGVGQGRFDAALESGELRDGVANNTLLTIPMNEVFGLETITLKPTETGGIVEITGLTALPELITFEGDGSVGSQVVNGLSINGTAQNNTLNLLYENGGTEKNGSYDGGPIKTGTIATINITVEDGDLVLPLIEGNNALRSVNFTASGDVTVFAGINTASALDTGDVITSIDASDVEGKFAASSNSLARNAVVTLGKDDSFFDATGSALPGTGSGTRPGVRIVGQGGDDIIIGTGFNDTIEGAGGSDNLTGGVYRDTFVYRNFNDSLVNSPDFITDFQVATSFTDTFSDVIQVPLQIDNKAEIFLLDSPTALTPGAIDDIYNEGISSETGQVTPFSANSIGVFEFNGRSFVTFNSGDVGFQSASDSILELNSASGATTANLFNAALAGFEVFV